MITADNLLREMGIDFPPIRKTGGGVVPYMIVDDLLFIGGVSPLGADSSKPAFIGRIGAEFTVEEGYKAARLVGLNLLQQIKDALGSLDRVDFVVKVIAEVAAAPGNGDMYAVADGCSDILTEALGERGMHSRNAVGASTLNANVPVICDAIVKIRA